MIPDVWHNGYYWLGIELVVRKA